MELEDGKKALILRQGIATWTHSVTLSCISFWNLQKKEIGKGMGLFNSGEIKTKLLTLPLFAPSVANAS